MARKDEERWEALRQAAFDYVKAYNAWATCQAERRTETGNEVTHASIQLQTEAKRWAELKKAGV